MPAKANIERSCFHCSGIPCKEDCTFYFWTSRPLGANLFATRRKISTARSRHNSGEKRTMLGYPPIAFPTQRLANIISKAACWSFLRVARWSVIPQYQLRLLRSKGGNPRLTWAIILPPGGPQMHPPRRAPDRGLLGALSAAPGPLLPHVRNPGCLGSNTRKPSKLRACQMVQFHSHTYSTPRNRHSLP